ncbi:MAG TPA: hypothetical protein VFV52_12450 [Bacilli bacterium]|nr:hypothetical protein [Bacilli bacterium]
MKLNISEAIDYLESKGFLVKAYGFPEGETASDGSASLISNQYRVIQGDYDTGMLYPHQLVEVAEQVKGRH